MARCKKCNKYVSDGDIICLNCYEPRKRSKVIGSITSIMGLIAAIICGYYLSWWLAPLVFIFGTAIFTIIQRKIKDGLYSNK